MDRSRLKALADLLGADPDDLARELERITASYSTKAETLGLRYKGAQPVNWFDEWLTTPTATRKKADDPMRPEAAQSSGGDFIETLDSFTDALESLAEVDKEAAGRVLAAAVAALEREAGGVAQAQKAMTPEFEGLVLKALQRKAQGPRGAFEATVAALGF